MTDPPSVQLCAMCHAKEASELWIPSLAHVESFEAETCPPPPRALIPAPILAPLEKERPNAVITTWC
jgi:hypothetical protein